MMPLGDRLQRCDVRRRGGDDGEFVAAEPRDQIVAAQRMRLRRCVTLRISSSPTVVAERVVDVLEVVEVDVEHRRRRPAVPHLRDGALEPFAEVDAVRQPAERIVQGEMAQLPSRRR